MTGASPRAAQPCTSGAAMVRLRPDRYQGARMNTVPLYALTVLIWGTSWFAVRLQLGTVHPVVSVGWRFLIAAALLFAWCALRGLPMRYRTRDHAFLAVQGVLLFSLNHMAFYLSIGRLTSGLVAVAFSTIVLMNIGFGALLLGTPVRARVVVSGVIGVVGLGFVFAREIEAFDLASAGTVGLGLALLATAIASLGNIAVVRNQQAGIPLLPGNAWSMGYGCAATFIAVTALGLPVEIELSAAYLGSLAYLTLIAGILAFSAYLTLIRRIGADRAAYTSVLFPIVALSVSTVFEGYSWTLSAGIGVALILLGNVVALAPARAQRPDTAARVENQA